MSLAEKTRPQLIQEMVLTDESRAQLTALKIMLETSPNGAILLIGPSGCGKTTAARILARMILLPEKFNASQKDHDTIRFNLQEINAGDENGIDTARSISEFLLSRNLFMSRKVVIIDEAQQMTKQAQNCILKPMEDMKDSTVIICTTDPSKIIPTIKNRCTGRTCTIHPINQDDEKEIQMVTTYLNSIATSDGYFPGVEIFNEIAKSQPNSMRAFVHKVDMLNAANIIDLDEKAKKMIVGYTEAAEAAIIDIVREIVKVIRDKDRLDIRSKFVRWKSISDILYNSKENPESIRLVMCSYITSSLAKMTITVDNINLYNAFLALGSLLVMCTNKKEINKDELYAMIFMALFGDQL